MTKKEARILLKICGRPAFSSAKSTHQPKLFSGLICSLFYHRITYHEQLKNADIAEVKEDLHRHQNSIISTVKTRDRRLEILYLAADQFVVKRQTEQDYKTTILAGFPWFMDWGRDAFIALPGSITFNRQIRRGKIGFNHIRPVQQMRA